MSSTHDLKAVANIAKMENNFKGPSKYGENVNKRIPQIIMYKTKLKYPIAIPPASRSIQNRNFSNVMNFILVLFF